MKLILLLNASSASNSVLQFLSFTSKEKSQISLLKLPSSSIVPRCSSAPCTNSATKECSLESNGLPQMSKSSREEEYNEKMSLSDQAFYLLAFVFCTASVAFTGMVIAAVPTLFAMRRTAISLSKLADTAREELPSTMAAIRLSGMEISDLILELNDLSQEITDGVNKSAKAVQAAEAGIRQISSLAQQQTMSMIQERASMPIISIQPVVAGAARKTSHAVDQATKTIMNIIYRGESGSDTDEDSGIDRVEI